MDGYLVIKACHVVSVVAWMAGLLYLPRLFVYHCAAAPGSELSETFKVMERRLMRAIMDPAMVLTWSFGLWLLALSPDYLFQPWFWVKASGILGLTWLHHLFGRWRVAFAEDRNRRSARTFRIANEAPTLALIVIVFMVIVKPF
jgi:putative membrane protein